MRLGNRVYIFFEKEVINAVQRQNEHQDAVDRTNQGQRPESQTPVRNPERSGRVGNNGKKAIAQQQAGGDPHGLLLEWATVYLDFCKMKFVERPTRKEKVFSILLCRWIRS